MRARENQERKAPPEPPFKAGCTLTCACQRFALSERDFVQTDVLDRGPDDCQATGFRREHVDLISSLADIAKETLNGIRRLNMPMHALRELVKGQQVLFILNQTSHCLWIALAVLGFEGSQLGQCLLLRRLLPDAHQFGLDIATLSSGDRLEDIALLVHQTALTRGGRKPLRDRRQQSIMAIRHDQINLGYSSPAQILQEAVPSILAFLGANLQSQNLFVSFQIHAQGGQDDRGIGLVAVTNAEMHAIQVQDTPMLLQRALSPRVKLLGQALVEATDGAGTGSDSHEGFGDFSDLVGAHPGHEHLHQPLGDVGFIATVAFKGLGVELTRAVVFAL
jgi:hypothetical protein